MIGPLGENLIFLISQPRSGSTLLQRMLGAHSLIHTVAEPWIMLPQVYALREKGHSSDYNTALAAEAINDFCGSLPFGGHSYWQAVRKFGVSLYNQALESSGKVRFLDKTPRYYLIARDLMQLYPEAHFIFLFRNPLAVLASVLETWVGGKWERLDSFRTDLVKAPELMLSDMGFHGEKTQIVRYGSVVQTPQDVLLKMCRELGVEFEPGMVNYGNFPKPAGRFGDPVSVNEHISPVTDCLDKWKSAFRTPVSHYLASKYLLRFEHSWPVFSCGSFESIKAQLEEIPHEIPSKDWIQFVDDFLK